MDNNMQPTIETLSPLERRMDIPILFVSLEEELKKRLVYMAKTTKIDGFRPGKVPLAVMEKRVGSQIREEVLYDHAMRVFKDTMLGEDVDIMTSPKLKPKPVDENQKDRVVVEAFFEVYPEVTVGDLTKVELTRPEVEATEANIDRTIGQLRRQAAIPVKVDREVRNDDRVICDFTAYMNGEALDGAQGRDFAINVGLGEMLSGIEEALIGMKAGETKHFPLTFPDNYHERVLIGKTADFDITAKEVYELQLPPLDDSFAKTLKVSGGTVEALREEVKNNLLRQIDLKIEHLMAEQVIAAIGRNTETELPKALVNAEINGMMKRIVDRLVEQGVKKSDIKLSPEMFRHQARERVKTSLGVAELVTKHDLAPKDEEIVEVLAEMAMEYEDPAALMKWYTESKERLAVIEKKATERNLSKWMQTVAQVTSKPMTLEELMMPGLTLVPPAQATA